MEKIPEQQPSNCLKIVLFGPESTGKTTLAQQLAVHYDTEWVPEFMRTYLQKKWDLKGETVAKEDLLPIARGQMLWENEASQKAGDFLFCDTNLMELKVYCDYYYGNCPPNIQRAAMGATYDHYFLTDIDIAWKADDLRDRPYDRSTLFCMFEAVLQNNNLPYTKLSGNEKERLEQAVKVLQRLKPI